MLVEMTRYEWQATCAGPAYAAAFGASRDPSYDTIDSGMLILDEERNTPVGYATIRERTRDMVELCFGGAFGPAEKTIWVARGYDLLLEHLRTRYTEASTLILNKNVTSLKLAMSRGWRIVGTHNYRGDIMVELYLNLREKTGGDAAQLS